MGRRKKNSEESEQPRPLTVSSEPISSRPRRAAKDAFYNKLSNLNATKKSSTKNVINESSITPKSNKTTQGDTALFRSANRSSLSTAASPIVLVPKNRNSNVLRIPVADATFPMINKLHQFLPELRGPQLQLKETNIHPLQIDPKMVFECHLCSRRFPIMIELEKHLGTHVEDITSCSLCDKPEKPFSMEEYSQHVSSHFIKESIGATCIFCGEIVKGKSDSELLQHLLYFCPNVSRCFICDTELKNHTANEHRRIHHGRLMNRYVCTTCFLGFPSLSPFLPHVCEMRYRCLCEITNVYEDHNSINQHIDNCDKDDLRSHGILIPQKYGRKRCFFVNPHAVMPSFQSLAKNFGFFSNPVNHIDAGDAARKLTFEMKEKQIDVKAPSLQKRNGPPRLHYPFIINDVTNEQHNFIQGPTSNSRAFYDPTKLRTEQNINDIASLHPRIQSPFVRFPQPPPRLNIVDFHQVAGGVRFLNPHGHRIIMPRPNGPRLLTRPHVSPPLTILRPNNAHLSQHIGGRFLTPHGPRIILPRLNVTENGPRMFTRIVTPLIRKPNIEMDAGSRENNKEITSTKRVSNEENKSVPTKRMRTSSNEPETTDL